MFNVLFEFRISTQIMNISNLSRKSIKTKQKLNIIEKTVKGNKLVVLTLKLKFKI